MDNASSTAQEWVQAFSVHKIFVSEGIAEDNIVESKGCQLTCDYLFIYLFLRWVRLSNR